METPPEHTTANSSGDESQKSDTMARRNTTKSFRQKGSELDLSTVLSPDEVTMLQVLMGAILDDMLAKIRITFDNLGSVDDNTDGEIGIKLPKAAVLSVPNPRSDRYRHMYGDIGLPAEKPDLDDHEALKEILRPNTLPTTHARTSNPVLALPTSPEETTTMSRKTDMEIFNSSVIELKRDVLGHFGKFRTVVLGRVQDIVIVGRARKAPGDTRRNGNVGRGRPASTSDPEVKKPMFSPYLDPQIFTFLRTRSREKRALILHSMTLLVLGGDRYTSYGRILLLRLAIALEVPRIVLLRDEDRISGALAQIIKGVSQEEIAQRRAEEQKAFKRGKNMVVASPTPTPVFNVLAEPLANAGVGTMFGRGLAPKTTANLLGAIGSPESTVAVGTLFGLYGARQGGKMIDAYAKDVQDFAMMSIHGSLGSEFIDPKDIPAEDRRMRVTIGIGGWITQDNDFRQPWQILGNHTEVYALRWELEAMMKMGTALETIVKNAAWISTSLRESRWPTGLLKISKVVDNPWTVAMVRAEKAGLVLAEILMNKCQGERAVTLIGYSLGARIIYSCLMSLAEKRAFGIVENVVMMGAPCPSDIHAWAAMKSVVAGRLINVWSKTDYLLGFLYRSCAWHYGVAGLQPVTGVPMVENVNVSNDIVNHLRYQYSVGKILRDMPWGWEDIEDDMVEIQTKKLMKMASEEDKLDRERHMAPWQERKVENVFFKQTHNQNQHRITGQATTQKKNGGHGGRTKPNGKENRRFNQGSRS
ncbi:hypothetical protein F4809DRAFT_645911 [Biscogniauxia mediterranea]|nr:hypothetical protein F4809DRAFT_645911 [Biscogniauxia mediterranea]